MSKNEIWKDIPNYEGFYQASSLGKIKRLASKNCLKDRLVKGRLNRAGGYYCVKLSKYGNKKNKQVHRLVALAFIPNPKNKPQINHKNGKKKDNNVENLEWATASENINHGHRTGLFNMKRKLYKDDMISIKYIYKSKFLSTRKIAFIFGTDASYVSKIGRGLIKITNKENPVKSSGKKSMRKIPLYLIK